MRRAALLLLVVLLALVAGDARGSGAARLRVGLVLEPPGGPFGHIAFVGFRRAVRELGVEGRALTPSEKEGFVPSFTYFARRGYDLVLGLGFGQIKAVDAVAVQYPRTRFVLLDSDWRSLKHRPRNVRGTVYRTEQAAYLAGYLAALLEKRRPGKDVVGTVAGYKIPTVDPFIAGFQAGARKADPGITTLNTYANDFIAPAKCKKAALEQIAKGSGAVFQVAGGCGFGALQAAKERGVWGIGVDSDQSFLGPHILTSVLKRMDVAAYGAVEALVKGQLETGRNAVYTLGNGGVGLGRISPKVPRAVLTQVDRVRRQIVSGKLTGIPATVS
ncbi:MAG: BMP family lipoprotein [Verrucomicrobiota bacterium]